MQFEDAVAALSDVERRGTGEARGALCAATHLGTRIDLRCPSVVDAGADALWFALTRAVCHDAKAKPAQPVKAARVCQISHRSEL